MNLKDSPLFEQPLNFVHQVKEGKHIVLFYEELEYAKMISFQFIKSGLVQKKECVYLSEEDVEAVKREMADSGIDVNKFINVDLLHIYQVPVLTEYHPPTEDYQIERKEEEKKKHQQGEGGEEEEENRGTAADAILKNLSETRQTDNRIVLRCIYKISTEQQIKSNLKWEHDYRSKYLKHSGATVVSTYPVNDIIPTISDSTGPYGKWMNDLLEIYDGVIFARRFWKGVAFNLS